MARGIKLSFGQGERVVTFSFGQGERVVTCPKCINGKNRGGKVCKYCNGTGVKIK